MQDKTPLLINKVCFHPGDQISKKQVTSVNLYLSVCLSRTGADKDVQILKCSDETFLFRIAKHPVSNDAHWQLSKAPDLT